MKNQQQLVQNKATIIAELRDAFQAVRQYITALSASAYAQRSGDRWSPAEQLEHLILSTVPIVGALGKDRDWFDQFDPPAHPDKSYADLQAYYKLVLSNGLKAPARFVPAGSKTFEKDQQLSDWERLENALIYKLSTWTEALLDQCTLPHPALGSLTMRQMLQFTTIHTYHHLTRMKI